MENHYLGHRERLRKRYIETGMEALNDYELLELLLFYSIPVKDTKPIAKQLIKTFGNIKNIFLNLNSSKIKNIKGVGRNTIILLKIVKDLCSIIQKQNIIEKKSLKNPVDVINFAKVSLGLLDEEVLYVLSLNSRNEIINFSLLDKGTPNEIYLYPRKILKKAIEDNATAIILIHNHPSGNTYPSENDIFFTKKIEKILKEIQIVLHDHIIVSADEYFSFKERGLIK